MTKEEVQKEIEHIKKLFMGVTAKGGLWTPYNNNFIGKSVSDKDEEYVSYRGNILKK